MQDKDELTMKKLKTEGGDKEGIKEAEVSKGTFKQSSILLTIHIRSGESLLL